MKEELPVIAAKAAPPVSVIGVSMAGVQLQDWVYILTIIWLVVQIALTGYKFIKDHLTEKKKI